jgi:hypothetical protein
LDGFDVDRFAAQRLHAHPDGLRDRSRA